MYCIEDWDEEVGGPMIRNRGGNCMNTRKWPELRCRCMLVWHCWLLQ